MEIEFDPAKDEANQGKHRISLALAKRFDLDRATVSLDDRVAYGEVRFRAWGFIDGVLYVLAFTLRGQVIRVISMRKANRKEHQRYGKDQT